MALQGNDLKNVQEGLKRQKDILEEQQRNIGTLTDSIQKVNARIEKVRENLQDEIGRQKEEIDSKINEVELY
jgi:chaperonin cofactor prefoldin